ncbi:MAG: AAA family ATPase [Bacillota bacterium]
MVLRNLNEMAIQSKQNYESQFVNQDLKLSREFKDRFEEVLESKQSSIQFFHYSAEIQTTSGNKIYCPNQWFLIATFVVEYISELFNYKRILESLAISEVHGLSKREFWSKIKNLKDSEEDIDIYAPEIKNSIYYYFQQDEDSGDLLCRFITDYSWWYGNKTIDRHDFYVSPSLNLLGLVNVSQSYVSDIANFMASEPSLMESALALKDEEFNNQVDSAAENLIVYGTPGTGKSTYLEENYANPIRVVFHSEYSYFDFVGSYKPVPLYRELEAPIHRLNGETFTKGEPIIDYQYVPGPFINVLFKAVRDKHNRYTLLIEELNRANAPSVFGDVFQLLDRKADGSSQYKITPNEDLKNYLRSQEDIGHLFEDGLFIPENMNIVSTMNSADQGVFVLDSAFKRRWKFKYMPIKESGFVHENSLVSYGGKEYKWRFILLCINDKLKNLEINEDRLIGPYFISPDEIEDSSSFASKLLIYLWDDVLRYKRADFFINQIRTYSELVSAYYRGQDVMDLKEALANLIEKEKQSEQEESSQEEEQLHEE